MSSKFVAKLDDFIFSNPKKKSDAKGGPGSGNWGHVGRPGAVGGSGGGGGHHKLPPGHQYHKPKPSGGGVSTADSPKESEKPKAEQKSGFEWKTGTGPVDEKHAKEQHSLHLSEYEKNDALYKKFYADFKTASPDQKMKMSVDAQRAFFNREIALKRMNAYRQSAESPNGKAFLEHELEKIDALNKHNEKKIKHLEELEKAGVKITADETLPASFSSLTPSTDGFSVDYAKKKYPGLSDEQIQKGRALYDEIDKIEKKYNPNTAKLYFNEPENPRLVAHKGMDASDVTPKKVLRGGAEKELKDFMGQSEVAIQLKPEVLVKIANQGRMKNMWESGAVGSISKGQGEGYKTARAKIEEELFATASENTAPKDRPIYGFLEHPDRLMSAGNGIGSNYGPFRVVLKPEVKGKTSYVIGDSLNDSSFTAAKAAAVTNPASVKQTSSKLVHEVNLGKNNNTSDIRFKRNPEDFGDSDFRTSYVEAQIHGGVSVSDIAKVQIPKGFEVSAQTRKKFEKAGVTIEETPRPLKNVYIATSWDDHYKED